MKKIVSQKYNLAKEEQENSSYYVFYRGRSIKEPERNIAVYAEKYESTDGRTMYNASLQYADKSYVSLSDDL